MTFLNLPINPFLMNFFTIFFKNLFSYRLKYLQIYQVNIIKEFFYNFFYIFFSCIWKCIKNYLLNIIKKIKKDYTHTHKKKETDVKDIKIFLRKKKKKKQQYGCESYKNLCEYENNKLVQHRKKNIIKWEKALYYNYKKVF